MRMLKYFMIMEKMANTPKKARDKNSMVVVHPSTGLALKKITTVYTPINTANSIISPANALDTLYPRSVNKIRLLKAISRRTSRTSRGSCSRPPIGS